MRRKQIAHAIDKPQKRTLAVGKIDVWHHAVHPRLAAHEEPRRVVVVGQIVHVGVLRDEQHHHEHQEEHGKNPFQQVCPVLHRHTVPCVK